jgi:hypothetical protein
VGAQNNSGWWIDNPPYGLTRLNGRVVWLFDGRMEFVKRDSDVFMARSSEHQDLLQFENASRFLSTISGHDQLQSMR